MKTTALFSIALFAACIAVAAPPAPVTVKGTKRTAGTHRNKRAVEARVVETTFKDVFYEFEIRSTSSAVPKDVTVKWVVVTLGMDGQPQVGTRGEQRLALEVNRAAFIETADFSLESRDINFAARNRNSTSSEEKIIGYGVRIFDAQGNQVAQIVEPENESNAIIGVFDQKIEGPRPGKGRRNDQKIEGPRPGKGGKKNNQN